MDVKHKIYEVKGSTVAVIGICDLFEYFVPDYWVDLNFLKYDYRDMIDRCREFCNANNCTWYSAPREDFSVYEGVTRAIEGGFSAVVVEDLS